MASRTSLTRLLFRPPAAATAPTGEPTRQKWPSRVSFVLAAMGGAVGVGNLLRYPSKAAKYAGLQWFLPYFLALFFVGIPLLALEIALGQTHRGGAVVANTAIHKRLRGLGLSTVYISFITATYYVVIMSWILVYFRHSFTRPLPWLTDNQKFFDDRVLRNVPAVVDPTGAKFNVYPATAIVGETLGWGVLSWFLIYLCVFRGVSLTGKIVYVTMLLPLILCLALLIRSVTLRNAWQGIRLYIAEWHTDKLRDPSIWQEAIIQIFFSIGTGFGYFIAYASYNPVHSNAVQDALIISLSNSFFEIVIAFAAFGVLGYLGLDPSSISQLSSFDIGFRTYPTALGQLPGANAWAALFFIIVYLLAIDSAFALVESFATVLTDSDFGCRLRTPVAMAVVVFVAMMFSFMYSTQFGLYLLDAMETWINGITLMFSAWLQCVAVTSMYRYEDVISQTGILAFLVAQGSYILSMVLGVILFQTVSPAAGVGVFAGVLVIGTVIATVISKTPEVASPCCGNRSSLMAGRLSAFWWLTSYSGHQLMRDLNNVVAHGRNWRLPSFWAPVLRWVTSPVLITMLSISYSKFYKKVKDPLHIFSFIVAHIGVAFVVIGFLAPVSFAWLVPKAKLNSHRTQYEGSPGQALVNSAIDELSVAPVTHDTVEDSTT